MSDRGVNKGVAGIAGCLTIAAGCVFLGTAAMTGWVGPIIGIGLLLYGFHMFMDSTDD
jgi:hypothetical protein